MTEIHRYLGLSTSHLPEHVINHPGGLNAIDGVIAYDYDYGTWLIVPEEIDVAVEEAHDPIAEIEQLWRYASEHDCDLIRLDRDEPEDPDLPTYEWPSHHRLTLLAAGPSR